MSIPVKSKKEIEVMRQGGKIAAEVLQKVVKSIKPGITTLELSNLAERLILKSGAKPSFKGFENYPHAVCININEGVVHGLPGKRKIQSGDLVTVDLGVYYQGYHTDTAETVTVGQLGSEAVRQFLGTGKEALKRAIGECREGNHLGDISHAIQSTVEKAGYSVVRSLVGHGVGKDLHEPPQIPCFGRKGKGPKLCEGMALAIEVIYAEKGGKVELAEDGWTIVTKDGGLAGLFEHTVAVTKKGPLILTL